MDQSRYPEILKLLYANFHPDEPMSRAVGMVDGNQTTNPILDDFALNGLKQVSTKTFVSLKFRHFEIRRYAY